MKRFFRNNGLSVVLLVIFIGTLFGGQVLAGFREYNQEREEHGEPPVQIGQYLKTPHFAEATSENWESEFLQMFLFVVLTSFLFQKGSAESHDPDKPEHKEDVPVTADSPWPVRRGGWYLRIYQYSLSIALFALFLFSFLIHAWSGAKLHSEEELQHGGEAVTTWEYVGTSRFWFESFQNWQSEFLAILSMVILSIFLRHRSSAESKPVAAPHSECGDD
jgi:hypothetical protein